MKILLIIPAYNEALNIENVLTDINIFCSGYDVLIVNDASIDDTGLISKSFENVYYLELCHNLGIGGTVQTGFKYADYYNYDIAIQIDGDGQHKAQEVEKLIGPIIMQECDAVIGSRFLTNTNKYKPKFIRKIGIKYLSVVISFLTGKKFTDCSSGFRAYNKRAIKFLSRYYSTDYPEPESIIILNKNKFLIQEVPVIMENRMHGISSINGLLNLLYLMKVTLTLLLNYIRPTIKD